MSNLLLYHYRYVQTQGQYLLALSRRRSHWTQLGRHGWSIEDAASKEKWKQTKWANRKNYQEQWTQYLETWRQEKKQKPKMHWPGFQHWSFTLCRIQTSGNSTIDLQMLCWENWATLCSNEGGRSFQVAWDDRSKEAVGEIWQKWDSNLVHVGLKPRISILPGQDPAIRPLVGIIHIPDHWYIYHSQWGNWQHRITHLHTEWMLYMYFVPE